MNSTYLEKGVRSWAPISDWDWINPPSPRQSKLLSRSISLPIILPSYAEERRLYDIERAFCKAFNINPIEEGKESNPKKLRVSREDE